MNPTREEQQAINALKVLAKAWPKSLWLYSAAGTLCVMRAKSDGTHALKRDGGVDDEYILDTVDIPNSGGDW